MAVNFMGGGNLSTRRKSPTCHKSLTNFRSHDVVSPWVGFELTTLLVIDTDCTGSCKYDHNNESLLECNKHYPNYISAVQTMRVIFQNYTRMWLESRQIKVLGLASIIMLEVSKGPVQHLLGQELLLVSCLFRLDTSTTPINQKLVLVLVRYLFRLDTSTTLNNLIWFEHFNLIG